MKCTGCQTENPDNNTFCRKCGVKLSYVCSHCGAHALPEDSFCGACGQPLQEALKPPSSSVSPAPETQEKEAVETGSERKHITVLFSDLSGYTAMCEKLDPEEVKEIMARIFGEIAQIVARYEGFIDKFIGDAVMVLFGVPQSHEDDPVRAIKTAREIHELVAAMSPRFEERLGRPLAMHSGINTGLVVTGELDVEKGRHGIAGDAINMASRLSGLARAGEILVGPDAHLRAEGYFDFEPLEAVKVKGKAAPVPIYRVLSVKGRPDKIHRLCGVRAELIGRKAELARLEDASFRLLQRKGAIISVCGDAGTGKSRLVTEFRDTLNLEEVQWVEGHAYAYSQNIPYFPLIDLLTRYLQIEEGDPAAKVREKIEAGIHELMGGPSDIVPYIGSLFSIKYPETENVGPEFWKVHVGEALQAVFSALAQTKPTVICLEDLHWADPSSLELIRSILPEFMYPALFLCIYRPTLSLFPSHQSGALGESHQEIRLQDLSASDALTMMESLLEARTVPSELRGFIQDKVEGNPFYLEEVVNSLIESERLIRDKDGWRLVGSISEAQVPSTIHGVISARLDRLERDTKRVLQEASVIGRAFFYEILEKVTESKESVEGCLSDLARLDLIRTRALEPDLEYVFKHALAQEVIYSGLLKKEREVIHERIARVMEQVFQDRLSEFYETLAFHYKQGRATHKAAEYLMKAGEKSYSRYAVEEAHQYYQEAYDILKAEAGQSRRDAELFIDLLIEWAPVFSSRGDYKGITELFPEHEDLAVSLDDPSRLGMFYSSFGLALYVRARPKEGYKHLGRALELGEKSGNRRLVSLACGSLAWTCAELGLLDEAVVFGERGYDIAKSLDWDPVLYNTSLGAIGVAGNFKGDRKRVIQAGEALLDFGKRHSDPRLMGFGHTCTGSSHMIAGDYAKTIQCLQRAIQISADPLTTVFAKIFLCSAHLQEGQFEKAEEEIVQVQTFSRNFGMEMYDQYVSGFLGILDMSKGRIHKGLKSVEQARNVAKERGSKYGYALFEGFLGRMYMQMVVRGEPTFPVTASLIVKNLGFFIRNLPFAAKKAEAHLNQAIALDREMGANWILGWACLDLAILHKAKKRRSKARECLSEAIALFEQCESKTFLQQAKEELACLK